MQWSCKDLYQIQEYWTASVLNQIKIQCAVYKTRNRCKYSSCIGALVHVWWRQCTVHILESTFVFINHFPLFHPSENVILFFYRRKMISRRYCSHHQKRACVSCMSSAEVCHHRRRRRACRICTPSFFCIHDRQRPSCQQCCIPPKNRRPSRGRPKLSLRDRICGKLPSENMLIVSTNLIKKR